MAVFNKRTDRACAALVEEADRARAAGRVEEAEARLREAATRLVAEGRLEDALDLLTSEHDFRRAGELAQEAQDFHRAAQLFFRGGELERAAEARVAGGEPLLAAELFERTQRFERAAEIHEARLDFVRASVLWEKAGDKQRAADLLVRALTGGGSSRPSGQEADELCRRAGVLYADIGHHELAVRVLRWGGQSLFAGKLLARAGRPKEAIELLALSGDLLAAAELARSVGQDARASGLLGERAEKDGRLEEAAEHYAQGEHFLRAARLFEYTGGLERAAEMYERAGQMESAAELYEQLGRFADAARCLRMGGRELEARALDERAAPHTEELSRALIARGEVVAACEALLVLARAGDAARYEEASLLLGAVEPGHRDLLRARVLLAEILAERGDTGAALSVLRELVARGEPRPEHVPALYHYARLLEAQGFLAGARNAYQAAVALHPGFRDARERLLLLRETDTAASGPSAPASSTVPVAPWVVAPRAPAVVRGEPVMGQPTALVAPLAADLLPLVPQASLSDLIQESISDADHSVGQDPLSELAALEDRSAPELPSEEQVPSFESLLEEAEEPAPQGTEPPRSGSLEGEVLRGRFRLERRIGRGAQAQVYLARDLVLDRRVAIKVLSSENEDEEAQERFLREARFAARVQHPGVVSVYDFGQERGITFMAMEFFRGRTLRERLAKKRLDAAQSLSIGIAVADALSAVHAAGIVHRDVKPSNILVDESAAARLTDFGVAIQLGSDQVRTGVMVGTMKYMSPEQARGRPTDPRSDLFSLGVVLFEMLSGSAPFAASLDALILRVTQPPPVLPADLSLPEELRQLVLALMQRKPKDRPGSAGLVADQLRGLALRVPAGPSVTER